MAEVRFGKWLREQRLDRGMTLLQFSEECGLSYVTLSNIENGKVNAGIRVLKKLAVALDKDYIELRNVVKNEDTEEGD